MSNEQDKATARPWTVAEYADGALRVEARDDNGEFCVPATIAGDANDSEYGPIARANAALIVRAVNAHEALVEACEADVRLMGNLLEDLERIAGPAVIRGIMDRMRHTRAALALARGN